MLKKKEINLPKKGEKSFAELNDSNTSAVDSVSGILKGLVPEDFDSKDLRDVRFKKNKIMN